LSDKYPILVTVEAQSRREEERRRKTGLEDRREEGLR
jgi:hypothetical protein